MIKRLKAELNELHSEIQMLKGECGEGEELTDEQRENLRQQCAVYVDDHDPASSLQVLHS